MNIEATKLELMKLLLNTNKRSVLTKIKAIFEEDENDWWNELSPDEKQAIERGLKQVENGEVIAHSEVMKQFDQWK